MDTETAKSSIEESLKNMGCTDVLVEQLSEGTLIAIFNCKEITSFVAIIPKWTNAGIHLDSSGKRQYKIEFKKTK